MSVINLTGTALLADGTPHAGAEIRCHKIVKDGTVISETIQSYFSNGLGEFDFNLIRASTAYLSGKFPALDKNLREGTPIELPDTASATLESLL